jgi:multicomponent Na+:H+ antiporter subunit D
VSQYLALTIIVPVAGAAAIAAAHRWPNVREGVTLVTAATLALLVVGLVPSVLAGERPAGGGFTVIPGLRLALSVEPLGLLFALVASSLWIANSTFSIGYMRGNGEPRQTSFYVCFAIALASTMGVAFADNLFTLFVFYEILTLSTYPLVAHKKTDEAMTAGRLYLLMLMGSSVVLLLPAILWTLAVAGTLDFRPGGIIPAGTGALTVGVLLLLYIFGIGKAAVMPMHRWLPAAMVAPTPVSALLHAVAVVKAGVFAIVKVVVYVFGVEGLASSAGSAWLPYVAGVSVIAASMVALRQQNLKRRLAYSTISQLSYVVLAVSIFAPLSVVGAALHIVAHAFGKITLFLAAGSVYTAAHITEIGQMRGIGRRMPLTMGAFAVGALAMIGIPPTAGFLGKWFMLCAALQSGQWWPVAVIVVSTGLTAAYFLPIVYSAFFQAADHTACSSHQVAPAHGEARLAVLAGEAPWPILLGLGITSVGTIVLFFASDVPYRLARAVGGL